MLTQVNQRLSNWKTRQLSFAGRLTLAKSVLQIMPSYAIKSTNLLMSICKEVDKKCRSFLWGDINNQRKIHTVAWKIVSLSLLEV